MSKPTINPVLKRIAVKARCVFRSPALIGSGVRERTENDILRDSHGCAFLPGSAVAGVLRALLPDDEKIVFGKHNKQNDTKQDGHSQDNLSPLWVFDARLTDDNRPDQIIELDSVAIGWENKVADETKKYDYEAVAPETVFTLRFLLTIRQGDSGKNYEVLLKKVLGALRSGSVAFGAKTRRGFGSVHCYCVVKREFDLTQGTGLDRWIHFDWDLDDKDPSCWKCAEYEDFSDGMAAIAARLKLDGSIMIRDTRHVYDDLAQNESAPDYKHISCNGKPVILGPSWAGAFRAGLFRLLQQKYPDKTEGYLEDVFGYVKEAEKGEEAASQPSRIVFGASLLKETDKRIDGYRSVTRVKIDRFTGGAAHGALLTEKPWYGGETTLEVRYPAGREDIRELILLGLEALDQGWIQIGGETAVGRGFFQVKEVRHSGVIGPAALGGAKPKLKDHLDTCPFRKEGETA